MGAFQRHLKTFPVLQVPVRDTQVNCKACKQKSTVADFVRRHKALVEVLENTPLVPSSGDVINSFIDGLKSGPKEWVLSQVPVGEWYTNPQHAYMKALQYETND